MKKIVIAIFVAAFVLGLSGCDGCQLNLNPPTAKPVPAKPSVAPRPVPVSKWVGRWINQKGNVSYIINSEKNGQLYGSMTNSGGKQDPVIMRLTGASTAVWTTPIGVQVRFTFQGTNQVVVNAVGVNATVLKIVK
jgi:hypothetical protein